MNNMFEWIKKLFKKEEQQVKSCMGCQELTYYNDGSPTCAINAERICIDNNFKLWKLKD